MAAAFRRGVDYNQIDESKEIRCTPAIQHRLILYYLEPNTPPPQAVSLSDIEWSNVTTIEKKKEVGFEANYMMDASTIVNGAGAATENLYKAFGLNLTLVFLHTWNLFGEEENYNKVRGSIFVGLGGTYASGFLGGLVRTGYEWRLGRHYSASFILGYRRTAGAFISETHPGAREVSQYGLGSRPRLKPVRSRGTSSTSATTSGSTPTRTCSSRSTTR